MDRQKTRKGHENRRFTSDELNFSFNENEANYIDKSKYRRHKHSERKKYEMTSNSYLLNWPAQPRMHSIPQRPMSTSDSYVCHYSVPLGFSFEPVSLPIYSALIQPQGNCTVPLEVDTHPTRLKRLRNHNKVQQKKNNLLDHNNVPAMFETPKVRSGDQQDYTSLPPVNCEIYTPKLSDNEVTGKRRFSDPGIAQISSDDGSSTRSDESSNSSETAEEPSNSFFSLVEQINELKENNSQLKKELEEAKLELESIKIQSQAWKSGYDDFKPGALSDAISEIRNAVKLGEEALISKVTQMLEKNSIEYKEAQEKLEKKLRQEMAAWAEERGRRGPEGQGPGVEQQLVDLEQEKLKLKKELQEAVGKRKVAESTTERLEKLVGILRKKINGVSLETCMPEEKHVLVRPLASSLEKNPFIIANNLQGQKSDTLPFSKTKIPPLRAFPLEAVEGPKPTASENKENEADQEEFGAGGNGKTGSSGSTQSSPNDPPSLTAQVTITGPVTDL